MDRTGELLDELALAATAAPIVPIVEGWTCTSAPELPFRRANAVLPAPSTGADPKEAARALDEIEAWYHSRERRVLIQVSSAGSGAGALDDQLATRGYDVEAPVLVMVAEAAMVVDAASVATRARFGRPTAGAATVGAAPIAGCHGLHGAAICTFRGSTDGWPAGYVEVATDASGRARLLGYQRMFAGLGDGVRLTEVTVEPADGEGPETAPAPAGVGFAVADRRWAGLFGIETAEIWRRSGIARLVVGALAADLVESGVDRLYLQVETGNEAGQRLYRGLGFVEHHRYHYRVSRPAR